MPLALPTSDPPHRDYQAERPGRHRPRSARLTAIRSVIPHAHITWIVNRSYEGPLLRSHPDLTKCCRSTAPSRRRKRSSTPCFVTPISSVNCTAVASTWRSTCRAFPQRPDGRRHPGELAGSACPRPAKAPSASTRTGLPWPTSMPFMRWTAAGWWPRRSAAAPGRKISAFR